MKIPSMIRSVLLLAVGASALQVQAQTLSSPADRDATARSAFATGDNTRAAAAYPVSNTTFAKSTPALNRSHCVVRSTLPSH